MKILISTAVDAFTLDYKVDWPLSLVINKRTVSKYQILFRHLFYCKYVERKLYSVWIKQKNARDVSLGTAFRPLFALRQKMMHFLNSFIFYMMYEVIEKNWHDFEEQICATRAPSLDDILKHHNDFLDNCLKGCLLSNIELYQPLSKVLVTCILYHDYVTSLTSMSMDEDDASSFDMLTLDLANDEHYQQSMKRFQTNFDTQLKDLMLGVKKLAQSNTADAYSMSQFYLNLNYNQFYEK